MNETRYGFNEHSTNACLYLCYDLCSPPTLSTLLVGCNLGHQLICQICCLAETVVLHWGCSPPWLIEESLIDHQLFPLWLCRSSYSLSRSICSNQSLFLTSYLVPRPPPQNSESMSISISLSLGQPDHQAPLKSPTEKKNKECINPNLSTSYLSPTTFPRLEQISSYNYWQGKNPFPSLEIPILLTRCGLIPESW